MIQLFSITRENLHKILKNEKIKSQIRGLDKTQMAKFTIVIGNKADVSRLVLDLTDVTGGTHTNKEIAARSNRSVGWYQSGESRSNLFDFAVRCCHQESINGELS